MTTELARISSRRQLTRVGLERLPIPTAQEGATGTKPGTGRRRGGEVCENSLEMRHFRVLPYPDEAALAPSWAAGVARDGMNGTAPPAGGGCVLDLGQDAKSEILGRREHPSADQPGARVQEPALPVVESRADGSDQHGTGRCPRSQETRVKWHRLTDSCGEPELQSRYRAGSEATRYGLRPRALSAPCW